MMGRGITWARTDKRPVVERRKEHAADPYKYRDGLKLETVAAQQGRSLGMREAPVTLARVGFLERGR